MRTRRSARSRLVEVAAAGFFSGAIAMAGGVWAFQHAARPPDEGVPRVNGRMRLVEPTDLRLSPQAVSSEDAQPPEADGPATVIDADPIRELRDRQLDLPVLGVEKPALRDSYFDKRGSTRTHEAIDIMASRNTPIVAVEDGTIARLFASKAGGTTVYQFDPSIRYVYYYAHLERYADGLQEGQQVRRGQVLGYVGTSGNAPKDTPHLHFAIFRLTDKKQWWQGTAMNPYDVLTR